MANQRKYNEYVPYDRPKIARNKYGLLYNNTTGGGSTIYGSSTNNVGGQMASLDDFRGATRTENGVRGAVPAPLAGMNTWFLQGSGNWTRIPAFDWIVDFPTSAGLEKTGIQVNGDLNVTDTITTMNLECTGAAHFWSLIIDEVKAQGGQVLVSPSAFHVDFVGNSVNYNIFDASENNPLINLISARSDVYKILKANDVENIRCRRLYQRCDDGKTAIENECQIGDMMRCRQFNIKAGEYRDVANKDYWTFICNTGEESYTDYDGNTFEAFYIDIAFTLRTSDGHNYPLGTTLFADGSDPIYPKGYTEITDALELKKTSQEAWDGSRDVEWPEYFENSEWSSITEQVIKIRGLDDQIQDITGKSSSNNLYDNVQYVTQAQALLNQALTGEVSTPTESTNTRSINSLAKAIVSGAGSTTVDDEPTGLDEQQAAGWSRDISGIQDISNEGLKVKKTLKNNITLAEDTFIERRFEIAEDVLDADGTFIYHKGDILNYGDTALADVNVIDVDENLDIKQFEDTDPDVEIDVPDAEKQIVTDGTNYTPSGMSNDVDGYIDTNYSDKPSWQFGYVGYYPDFRLSEGDSLACLGHMYDTSRQNAIVLSSTNPIDSELVAPAIAQYSHIDLFGKSISQFRQTAIAANGNEFIGSFLVNYNNTYVDINERINMMIMDVKSGLEKVGIHLDGDSSTITLVGSVDLKQHAGGDYDTLNLYDNLGVKRVEITPFTIPAKGSSESQIDVTSRKFSSTYDWLTASSKYITRDQWKDWDGPFWYSWVYSYKLENYIAYFNTSANLGYLEAGTELDLRDLVINLKINTWLVGRQYDADRGMNKQGMTGPLTWALKRNGVAIKTGTPTPRTSGDNSADIVISLSEVELSSNPNTDYKVPDSGTYTLDISFGYKVYAYVQCGHEWNNYYYIVECSMNGSVGTYLNTPLDDGTDSHKLTIGTNGFELVTNNSRWFYAANDGFELAWDGNYITMDETHGLYIKKQAVSVRSNTQLGTKNEIIFCENTNPHSSYTVTLPDPSQFGRFREITILGWVNMFDGTKLTIAAKGSGKIEVNFNGYQEVSSFDFGDSGCPVCACTLMATDTNRWRIINMT